MNSTRRLVACIGSACLYLSSLGQTTPPTASPVADNAAAPTAQSAGNDQTPAAPSDADKAAAALAALQSQVTQAQSLLTAAEHGDRSQSSTLLAINGKAGAERSVFGSLANSLVGHTLGLISSGFEKPTFKDGMYFYASKSTIGRWLTQHAYDAITFGNVVNTTQDVIDAGYGTTPYPASYAYAGTEYGDKRVNPQWANWVYAHEIDHYRTQDILGAYYIPLHAISQGLGSAETGVLGRFPPTTSYLEQWPFKLLPYGNP